MKLLLFLLLSCSPQEKSIETPDGDSSPTEEVEAVEETGDIVEDDTSQEESCSFKIGDQICNVTLPDVDGVLHDLHSYQGRTVVIQLSAEWCGPCHHAGTYAEDFMARYADTHDLLWVTIILENSDRDPATTADLVEWETAMGTINALTLAGSRDLIDLNAEVGFPVTSWPTFVVLSPDSNIYIGFNGWSEPYLANVLDSMP